MGYPQQPQNDPNQYQQQPRYPKSPKPGTPNFGNINFAALTTTENRPYLSRASADSSHSSVILSCPIGASATI